VVQPEAVARLGPVARVVAVGLAVAAEPVVMVV